MAARVKVTNRYDEANLEAGTIIGADPEKYPPGSLAAEWADLVASRAAEVKDAEAGPLFENAA